VTIPAALDREFAELRDALQDYGRSRFPALRRDIDDLVAQSLADLWAYLKREPDTNERDAKVSMDIEASTLRKLAFTIFKRRAADAYRQGAKRWVTDSLESDAAKNDIADTSGVDADRAALFRRMLQVCIAELADAPAEDRTLLALTTGLAGPRAEAMSARDRQRLHRLRTRLAAAIRRELGEDAATLLGSDS
jgi:hypothetical protein